MAQNAPVSAGHARGVGLIPGSGSSPRGGSGNPLHYSCLENSMGRGAWRATVHRVAESDMTEQLSTHIKLRPGDNVEIILRLQAANTPLNHPSVKALLC